MKDKEKKYIAVGIKEQEEVDKLIEIFSRAVRKGYMTEEEMEIIGGRESWFIRNPNYKEKENESKSK